MELTAHLSSPPGEQLVTGFGKGTLIGVWNLGRRLRKEGDMPPELPPPKLAAALRFVCCSDTHSYHAKHEIPDGDVFIHAGDWTRDGEREDIESFVSWVKSLPHKHKIVIAGNHDLPLDDGNFGKHFLHARLLKEAVAAEKLQSSVIERDAVWEKQREKELIKELPRRSIELLRSVCTYLVDQSVIIDGVTIHGSPWVPGAKNWAYSLPRDSTELAEKWAKIDPRTVVLVTHVPPAGLRLPGQQDPLKPGYLPDPGCVLLQKRQYEVKPLVHLCGHIHEHYGVYTQDNATVVINAAMVDARRPIVFDIRL